MRPVLCVLLLCCFVAPTASAQVSFENLWPDQDGLSWSYDGVTWEMGSIQESFRGRLILDGYASFAPGVIAHSLMAQLNGQPAKSTLGAPEGLTALQRSLWFARPELRKSIEQIHLAGAPKQVSYWPSLLLGPSDVLVGVGLYRDEDHKGVWRDEIGAWSWWYFPSDLTPGTEFTLQLVPDLADDVFLNGSIRTDSGTVSTAAGSWTDALVVDYDIDQGVGTVTDESGNVLGTVHIVTRGWVAFVPDVGPVASHETTLVEEIDCPGCTGYPDAGEAISWVDLALSIPPVAVEGTSWGQLKARF